MSQENSQNGKQFSHHAPLLLSILNQIGLGIVGLTLVIFCLLGSATIALASAQFPTMLVASEPELVAVSSPEVVKLAAATPITVYRSPTCSCCGRWTEHLQEQGFQVSEIEQADMAAIKQRYGVSADLESCHTAIVNGYLIEGHVPATDIQQLLAERPDVTGITAPGMPVGSPGMESGDRHDPFSVLWFRDGEVGVFSEHPAGE